MWCICGGLLFIHKEELKSCHFFRGIDGIGEHRVKQNKHSMCFLMCRIQAGESCESRRDDSGNERGSENWGRGEGIRDDKGGHTRPTWIQCVLERLAGVCIVMHNSYQLIKRKMLNVYRCFCSYKESISEHACHIITRKRN